MAKEKEIQSSLNDDDKHRIDSLNDQATENFKFFDKALLTINTGAIAFVLHTMANNHLANFIRLKISVWCFCVSLIISLLAFLLLAYSQQWRAKKIKYGDALNRWDKLRYRLIESYDKAGAVANPLALVLLVIGAIFLVISTTQEVHNMTTKKSFGDGVGTHLTNKGNVTTNSTEKKGQVTHPTNKAPAPKPKKG